MENCCSHASEERELGVRSPEHIGIEDEKVPVNIQSDSSLQVRPRSEQMDKENKDSITERREEESGLIYCSSRTGSPKHIGREGEEELINNKGDSGLQVPPPSEVIEDEKGSSFLNNSPVPAPPNPFRSDKAYHPFFVPSSGVSGTKIFDGKVFCESPKHIGRQGEINNKGDSGLQTSPPSKRIEDEKKGLFFMNNPPVPAPPNPFRSDKSCRPFVVPSSGVSGNKIFDGKVFCDAVHEIQSHLARGGTDVESIKRKYGIPDEMLRGYKCPTNVEEFRQNYWILGGRFIQACVEKLNQIANQFDDWELVDVLFVESPHHKPRYHMHFRAMHKSKADPGQESSGLYCAVVYALGDECHVLGCVLLENDCPGSSNAGTLGECLDARHSNARAHSELVKAEDDESVELSRSIDSARKIQMQGVYKEIDREREGMTKTKEISFSGLRKCNDGAWFPAKRTYV